MGNVFFFHGVGLQQLLGHAGHELFQVEGFEVGYVLEVLFGYSFFGQWEHHAGQRTDVVKEVRVGMSYLLLALGGSVAEEVYEFSSTMSAAMSRTGLRARS